MNDLTYRDGYMDGTDAADCESLGKSFPYPAGDPGDDYRRGFEVGRAERLMEIAAQRGTPNNLNAE